jgi:hypothetical protein
MVAWGIFRRWSCAVNKDPSTPLKISAIAFALLWTTWMLWWSGSPEPANIVILAICGGVAGMCWFVATRFIFRRARLLARTEVPRGKLYPWIVWTALMALTGIATAFLLDLVAPLIPAGDWHWLIRSLFVIIVWPALVWSLRPLLKRHLPERAAS